MGCLVSGTVEGPFDIKEGCDLQTHEQQACPSLVAGSQFRISDRFYSQSYQISPCTQSLLPMLRPSSHIHRQVHRTSDTSTNVQREGLLWCA